MSRYEPPVLKARREQMYFPLTDGEIERLHSFGETRAFAAGDYLAHAGDVGIGMLVILSGRVRVSRKDGLGPEEEIRTYEANEFAGEVSQLSGRTLLVDIRAQTSGEVLVVSPAGLRGLVIAEAVLGERIMRALILRRVGLIETGAGGPVLVGPERHPGLVRLQSFLARNGIPHRVLDPANDHEADALVISLKPKPEDLPLVVCPDGSVLRNPDQREVAERVGLLPALDPGRLYDVAIVGAGPAGLATAVYAASEGLSVIVLESNAFGGQAGASSRIENYLGFPTGISGLALTARAFIQAQKFGADVAISSQVQRLDCGQDDGYLLEMTDGSRVAARTVVAATGADYRKPSVPGLAEAAADGVHYWASPLEARVCADQEVTLVGGGNSAGQAAVYLAAHARKVWMLVRGPGIEATMSRYMVDRIGAQPNIELLRRTAIERVEADSAGALARVVWRDGTTGEVSERAMRHLFLFIGASPCTRWLQGCGVAIDEKGFIFTGAAVRSAEKAPPALMTSVNGVFAIGDVRSGSTKRVAAAVGEGAAVVAQIHAYLGEGAAGRKPRIRTGA